MTVRTTRKVIAAMLLACICICQGVTVKAEEIEDYIIEENLGKSTKRNPIYTNENIKNGIIDVPAGTYNTITISYNLKNVVLNLDNVTVNDRIILFGSSKKKATMVISGKTKIGTIFTKRNLNIIAASEKRHIGTLEVKGDSLSVSVNARAKSVLLMRECTNSTVTVNKVIKSFSDLGNENRLISYAPVSKVNITGENSNYTALEKADDVYVSGYGNRISIKCNEFGKITSVGARTLIVGQTENNKPINMEGIEIQSGSYMLIRSEQLCSVTDNRTDAAKASEYVQKNVLFIGDSFIERLYTRGLLKTNMATLCAYGSAPSDWYESGNKHLDYLNELYKYDPTKIVYYYGINEIYEPDNIAYSERLLTDLMAQYPKATIYVMKIFPLASNNSGVGPYDYHQYNHIAEYSVDRYNGELESFCKKYTNLVWCDTTADFLDGNKDMKRSKTVDGLHLSSEACVEWMNVIKKTIKE